MEGGARRVCYLRGQGGLRHTQNGGGSEESADSRPVDIRLRHDEGEEDAPDERARHVSEIGEDARERNGAAGDWADGTALLGLTEKRKGESRVGLASLGRKGSRPAGKRKNELGLRAKMREGEFVLFLFSSFISKPISNLSSKQFKSF